MTELSHKLARWVIKLGGEVRSLKQQAPYLPEATLVREIKQVEEALKFIYTEAQKQQVNLLSYYDALADIEANLKLIQMPAPISEPLEKIAIFIDGANLNAMAYDQLRVKIDFAKLLNYFGRNGLILRAFYYLATDTVDRSKLPFLAWLGRNGYQVVTKPMKEFDDGTQKGNLDIEIAIDMLELADKVDRVVLVSGDGDFAPLLKRVGSKGARTQVVAYWGHGEGGTAPELLEAADTFTELQDIIRLISRE